MNAIPELLNYPFIARVGWGLVHSLRQGLLQKVADERLASEISRGPAAELIGQAVAPTRPSTARASGAVCIALGLLCSLTGIWLAKSDDGPVCTAQDEPSTASAD